MRIFWFMNATDCVICAIKPILQTGVTVSFIAKSKCQHRDAAKKPELEEKFSFTLFATLWASILLAEVSLMIYKLLYSDDLTQTMMLNYIFLMPNFINTIIFSYSIIWHNRDYLFYTNCLIDLIHNRKLFGMEAILEEKHTRSLQKFSFLITYLQVTIWITSSIGILGQMETFNFENILLSLSSAINTFNAMNYTIYFVVILMIYKIVMRKCLTTIEEELETPSDEFLRKLKSYQRFYMTVLLIYRRHVFAFGNVLLFGAQFVFLVFALVESYLHYFKFNEVDGNWIWLSNFRTAFSVYVGTFVFMYYQLNNDILFMVSIV